jgi:hypothetical protein
MLLWAQGHTRIAARGSVRPVLLVVRLVSNVAVLTPTASEPILETFASVGT